MREEILVSVIINNYNYGNFLSVAIDSVLQQSYSAIEVIVVDDGSTDNSREIISQYGNKLVPILKENGGQASAFNSGFAASRGDIICFLDSDDYFLPNKVDEVFEVFNNREFDWCFHSLRHLDINQNLVLQKSQTIQSSSWDYREAMKNGNLPYLPCATSGLCFRRDLLKKILPMPEATNVVLSDNYLKFAASALGKGFFLDKELAVQIIHGHNIYTLRKDKQLLRSKIQISTAYWLNVRFPFLYRFTNRLLIDGIRISWCVGRLEPELLSLVKAYILSQGFLSRITIGVKACYYYLKDSRKFWLKVIPNV